MKKIEEKEIVGIFVSKENFDSAINDLSTDFPRDALSVLANEESLKQHLGDRHPNPNQVLNNEDAPTEAPALPESATIGKSAAVGVAGYVGAVGTALAMGAASLPITIAVAAAAGLSTGGASAVLVKIFGDRYDKSIEEQIEAGGLMLWVRISNKEETEAAKSILIKHGAKNIEIF